MDHDRRVFNYRLSRARRIVENAFGRLAAVWRIFQCNINLQPEKIDKVVLACCALHNFVLKHRGLAFTTDTDAYVEDGSWRGLPRAGLRGMRPLAGGNTGRDPKAIRDQFKQYFNGLGSVNWQEHMITLAANDLSDEE